MPITYECPVCNAEFQSLDDFLRHAREGHYVGTYLYDDWDF